MEDNELPDEDNVPKGTEWFSLEFPGNKEGRPNCPKCEGIMCEDQAMSAVFELMRKNLGKELNVKTFEISCWACQGCGHRQGFYQRYEPFNDE